MARTLRDPKLDTRTARSRLGPRREPYWRSISDGLAIGYRKGAKGGTWIARHYTPEGGRRFSALGAADDVLDPDGVHALTFSQAQEAARAWFATLAQEKKGGALPGAPYTVSMALADYRADYERRGGKATDHHNSAEAVWIMPELGAVPLDQLTKRQITQWHQKIADSPRRARGKGKPDAKPKQRELDPSPEGVRKRRSTANRVLTLSKATLNHAHREGHCANDDAWRAVRAFREVDAARLRYLSDDEARRLTNACPADFRPMVQAALLTGCRYGELCALTTDDFNPDAGTVRVRVSKSGNPRHVVLAQEGRDFFTAAAVGKLGSDRLFTRPDGKPWQRSEQARLLATACKTAKISPSVSFHGLRHTYASRLAMKAVPLQVIATQLGHADTRMVEKHYGHLAPSYIADTVRAAFGPIGIVAPTNIQPLQRHSSR